VYETIKEKEVNAPELLRYAHISQLARFNYTTFLELIHVPSFTFCAWGSWTVGSDLVTMRDSHVDDMHHKYIHKQVYNNASIGATQNFELWV
jgi:hypothetical protein